MKHHFFRFIKSGRYIFLLNMLLVNNAYATFVWTGCVTVKGIADYRAYDSTVYVHTSGNYPSCTTWAGQFMFRESVNNVSSEYQKGVISLTSTALVSGKQVQIYYDDSSAACASQIIILGGAQGQCQ